ncbi:hypothetical protein HN512_00020 [Candidatus Peregrinibacteria bacterium]|jgi:hypothetical protein|nr:hypothetical protein [Candidatus Peregrinibacteria bacterium]MBT3598214.1 hypothetical protein [Candidatus Peregrinibacteria bacterium]MBT4367639.1 hypothetical protein [Candidatus Peregrinibacteria bacterium]MBT4585652.1 hypothetical protein [Candidatus Peregrinibacteria bacterium]MBT6730922.1 hypothetical protein [Candidatus Peregrinibacteria bacterium]
MNSFYKAYGATLLVGVLLLTPNALLLFNADEFSSFNNLEDLQRDSNNGCLYSSALHNDVLSYKLHMYSKVKPDTVAIGSSRMMKFNNSFFQSSFYNLADSQISSMHRLQQAIDSILKIHTPKNVILGFDVWWFNPLATDNSIGIKKEDSMRFSVASLFVPFEWLWEKKISPSEYVNLVLGRTDSECNLGIKALFSNSGIKQDGSLYDPLTPIKGKSIPQNNVASDIKAAQIGIGRFAHSDRFDEGIFQDFVNQVRYLEEQGINVVVIVPPLAPNLLSSIKNSGDISYFTSVLESLERTGITVVNNHNPLSADQNICDFIDGIHGYTSTFAKLVSHFSNTFNQAGIHIHEEISIAPTGASDNIFCDYIENKI